MTVDEFVKQIVLQLPSFGGLILAVVILYRQNDRLLTMIERLCEPCANENNSKLIEQTLENAPH